jgi:ABC-type multidrug transport system ATPase subunit
MALVGDLDLLLLDEPTVGLDIASRRAFWQTIAARRDAGVGILLTTHIVEDLSGLDVAARLHSQRARTRLVIVTTFARSGYLRCALQSGVSG